jgi:hypothetical protein
MNMRKLLGLGALVVLALGAIIEAGSAFASHNGAFVDIQSTGDCGETTLTAGIVDPDSGHKSNNMYLVVHADGETQFVGPIPTDGSTVSITVGPFVGAGGLETISWNVFGGGERDYDQPLWNGYGGATFGADIGAYAAEQGGYGWVLDGPDEPNPFTNFNEFDVDGCVATPESKDDCKHGGWAELARADGSPFKNQGDCIQYVNTGK